MIQRFETFDKFGRRFWAEVEFTNDYDFGFIIEDVCVWIETNTRRREVTKYVPMDMLENIEMEAINYVESV